jgi:alpha-galactosidase
MSETHNYGLAGGNRWRQRARLTCLAAVLALSGAPAMQALDNGVARTPPLGWNSWNKFACNVSEDLIKSVADAVVRTGMKDAGYQYVVIDDCWQVSRDAGGNIVPDPQRFPSGMRALADYVHSKGLKFGIYTDAGTKTCEGRPGSRGYEFQDARQYAAWGVDYLKEDWCNTVHQDPQGAYMLMSEALQKSGRPIVFSICEWGSNKPWLWAGDVGNLWRATGDISDKWYSGKKKDFLGVLDIIDLVNGLEPFAGPGHWNDPDMLEVGNGGMSVIEYRSHFSLWCLLAAPLIAGNDIRSMSDDIRTILTNKEAIAIDQDPLGRQGRRVASDGSAEVWSKQLSDGGRAVVLLNRDATEKVVKVAWSDIGYPDRLSVAVRDLWAHKDLGRLEGGYSTGVPGHGVAFIRVLP